jgi:hypothetical protein
MKIGDVMHRDVQIIGPQESLRNAVTMMKKSTSPRKRGEVALSATNLARSTSPATMRRSVPMRATP